MKQEQPLQTVPAKLKLSRYAWDKINYLQEHKADGKEIFFFAVSAEDDLLYVEDVIMTEQKNGNATVEVTDEGIAKYVADQMKEIGTNSDRYMRIWIHTHPKGVSGPSGTDETIWKDIFGACPWTAMFILPEGGDPYCRLRVKILDKYHIDVKINVEIARYSHWSKYFKEWEKEADENMKPKYTTYNNNLQNSNWQNEDYWGYGFFREGGSVDSESTGQDGDSLGTQVDVGTESPDFSKLSHLSGHEQEYQCLALEKDFYLTEAPHKSLQLLTGEADEVFRDYCQKCTGKSPWNLKKDVLAEVLEEFIYDWQVNIEDVFEREEMEGYVNDKD